MTEKITEIIGTILRFVTGLVLFTCIISVIAVCFVVAWRLCNYASDVIGNLLK